MLFIFRKKALRMKKRGRKQQRTSKIKMGTPKIKKKNMSKMKKKTMPKECQKWQKSVENEEERVENNKEDEVENNDGNAENKEEALMKNFIVLHFPSQQINCILILVFKIISLKDLLGKYNWIEIFESGGWYFWNYARILPNRSIYIFLIVINNFTYTHALTQNRGRKNF